MPPKKSIKTEQKVKQKIVEDKTFGLKNKKKSTKVNKYVQQLQQQAQAPSNRTEKQAEDQKKLQEAKKKAEAERKAQLAELFKPIQTQQKVPFGVDPKTILCQYFKQGTCTKGNKCKFSHDVDVERKAEKINIYEDNRKKEDEDTMEDWDQTMLEDVIAKKHVNENNNKPTQIVCKHFIEAIESRKYGWFWICPSEGDACKYKHALPPGFVLKKKETEEERRAREENEKDNEISLEEFLDTERYNLGTNLTPITYITFMKWKQERKSKQKAEEETAKAKKAEAYKQMKAGSKSGLSFSGRELFDFNPEWATGNDAEDGAMDVYEREASDREEENGSQDQNDTADSTENVNIDEELFEDLDGLDIDDDDDDDE